ncbi:arsenate reductase ArsC [Cribrihabitans neustonicus]|uniref:arsenate reductase ArsC n=1 Tax=Cribrihabitans neustonicus TaxID=1429085 RepID=UPI003B5BB5B3
MNILVLCTGNSARSILLEAIFNHAGRGIVRAYSAGSTPTGLVHPQSLALLTEKGIDVSSARSKSWDEFAGPGAPEMDLVITVCAAAAGETCPVWPGAPLRAHWGVPDPAAAKPEDWDRAFRAAFKTLERRAKALLALPLKEMAPEQLRAELARIGELA